MAAINAARLRLRAPGGWSVRAQARTEDALRTGAPDDNRLVVIKRLDLGRLPLDAHPRRWSEQAGARLSALAAHAVHGGSSSAPQADAVWFADAAEAQRLLLAELAAGRTPFAWFWRLALPDWDGATLGAWLPRLLAAAEHEPEAMAGLAHAVAFVAGRSGLAAIIAALPVALRAGAAPTESSAARSGDEATRRASAGADATAPDAATVADIAAVLRLFAWLPTGLRSNLAAAWRQLPPGGGAAMLLARVALIVAAPALAASPSRLARLAECLPALVIAADSGPAAARPDVRPATAPAAVADAAPALLAQARATTAAPAALDEVRPASETAVRHDPEPDTPAAPVLPQHEQRTAAAGLWLLIRPLHVMGFGEWLDARPSLATDGFARALLRHIAERQRIAATDPLFALLPALLAAPLDAPLDAMPRDHLDAWRIGLDRWLRKRTRRTLAHVVKRPGWVVPKETGVGVRFRVDQADVALRRRALDLDAGWVPWLGLSVRYHFRDAPLA